MLKKLKNMIMSAALFGALLSPGLLLPVAVSAADCIGGTGGGIQECLDQGAQETDPTATQPAGDRVGEIIRIVINIFSLVVGVIAVIMIIIGGLKYITSGGDSVNVTSAKNTILYAIVGLIIVALAQIIVRFVLAKVTTP